MPSTKKQHVSSILVIENDEVNACLVEYLLQREGYHVDTVYTEKQSSEMFNALSPPDLIFMGSQLHFAEPIAFINRIHASPDWSHAPVVLMVNETHDDIQKLEQLLKTGVDDYLLKPFGPGDILAMARYFVGAVAVNSRL